MCPIQRGRSGPLLAALLASLLASSLTLSCGEPSSQPTAAEGLGRWLGPPPPPPPAPPPCRWFSTPYFVFFAPGSAEIDEGSQPERSRGQLERVVEDHRRGEPERIRAVGYVEYYCPSAPSDPELARERGTAVIERLIELGVPREAFEQPPMTLPVCCTEADDPCDPNARHRLRGVEINYWRCEGDTDATGSPVGR